MHNIRVVYMGTPEFSLQPLDALTKLANVVLVVSKKDAYVGRKKILTPSPVKKFALENNIPVFTPDSIKKEYQTIIDYQPDLIITCAYGKIIPKELLDYPKYGCINIHASLLPKYRGAAPIQWAIINGEDKTGVTLMYMDEGMDTGDIICERECQITSDDNIETLTNKLSTIGTNLFVDNLENIVNNKIERIKQDDTKATIAKKISRDMEEIDFNQKGQDIINKIRAFSPYPLTRTILKNEEIKIVKAHFKEAKSIVNNLYVDKNSLGIGCQDGIIYLDEIKPIGKNIMNIKSYLNGKKDILK